MLSRLGGCLAVYLGACFFACLFFFGFLIGATATILLCAQPTASQEQQEQRQRHRELAEPKRASGERAMREAAALRDAAQVRLIAAGVATAAVLGAGIWFWLDYEAKSKRKLTVSRLKLARQYREQGDRRFEAAFSKSEKAGGARATYREAIDCFTAAIAVLAVDSQQQPLGFPDEETAGVWVACHGKRGAAHLKNGAYADALADAEHCLRANLFWDKTHATRASE